MRTPNLPQSLVEAIGASQLPELTSDVCETFLDDFMRESILKEIPVLGVFLKATKLAVDVNNYLFLKKLSRFLLRIQDVPEEERKAYIGQLHTDGDRRAEVGEGLILILNKLDDIAKADLLGKLFKAHLMGKLSYNEFRRASVALDRCAPFGLSALRDYYSGSRSVLTNEEYQELGASGLVTLYLGSGAINGGGGHYWKNDLGQLFAQYALEVRAAE